MISSSISIPSLEVFSQPINILIINYNNFRKHLLGMTGRKCHNVASNISNEEVFDKKGNKLK